MTLVNKRTPFQKCDNLAKKQKSETTLESDNSEDNFSEEEMPVFSDNDHKPEEFHGSDKELFLSHGRKVE